MPHNRRTLALLSGCAALAVLLAACQPPPPAAASTADAWGTIRVPAGGEVQVAVALAGGDTAAGDSGVEQLRGVELALGRAGAIHGFPVTARVLDAGCDENVGIGAATRVLADSRNVAVIGHSCSSSCEAAAPLYENARLTMISPGCTAPALTDSLLHIGSFLRTTYDETLEAAAAAEFAYEALGARRAVILTDGSVRAEALGDTFAATLGALGGEVTQRFAVPTGEQNFRPVLQAAAADSPDVIFAPLEAADGARAVMQSQTTGLANTPVVGDQSLLSQWFIQEAGRLAAGTYAVGPLLGGDAYEVLRADYVEAYGAEPSGMAFAYGYDATVLTLDAIERAAGVDKNGDLLIGKQALRDAIYSTANLPGLTGALTCSRWGECSSADLAVWQASASDWTLAYIP